ncbi:MAG: hydrogenase maturation protease [Phycisphaerae bacterium]|nr:hydrogenase maturation protease [Phycisphaerae bacterium]
MRNEDNAAAGSTIRNPKSEIALTVVGVGNLLMSDDGVGVRIIEQLGGESRPSPRPSPQGEGEHRIEYLDGSVGGLRLLNWIEQANRLLFVDAARFGGEPGECRLFALNELLHPEPAVPGLAKPGTVGSGSFSLHQTDLLSVLRLARQFYRVPPTWLLAIGAESVQPGDHLSPPLERALPRLVETARRLARRLATG